MEYNRFTMSKTAYNISLKGNVGDSDFDHLLIYQVFNLRAHADIVNYIRLNPESFSEWHKSETAKMFAPPVFRNEKKASGYFF